MVKSKGLGDSIEKMTEWTGLKKLVKQVVGEDCGCEERKEKLNKMFPYYKDNRPFTEDEKKVFQDILPLIEKNNMIIPEHKTVLTKIYEDVFKAKPQWSSCGSCNQKTLDNLKKAYAKSCSK
tara:strand:+ start:14657 stop:15022 length:366 start_codon:yes stop_codon:yes gene_type:complete